MKKNVNIQFTNTIYLEYEHLDGYLVAIEKDESKKVGVYHKKFKGKKDKPIETVKGYKFILDEEFNSLKIDFKTKLDFEIHKLNKVKLT